MKPFICLNAQCGTEHNRTVLGYTRRDGSLFVLPNIADPKRGTQPGVIVVTCCACGSDRVYVGTWQRFTVTVSMVDVTEVRK